MLHREKRQHLRPHARESGLQGLGAAPRPRLYVIDPKTVFRGGYGISYVHLNRLGSADELGINGPQVVIGTVNQSIPRWRTASRPASSRRNPVSRPAWIAQRASTR